MATPTRQVDVSGFLDYRKEHPDWKPSANVEKALQGRIAGRVDEAHGGPPEGWSDWAYRVASETPGALSRMFSTDMSAEEQLQDFGKTLPGMGANVAEGGAGMVGDASASKWDIVNAINQYFNSPDNFVGASSNMDQSLDLARAKKFDQGNFPTSEGIRENVTRPLVGESVDYEPKGPAGKIGDIMSTLVGIEDLVPAGAASKAIKLLRKAR